MGKLIDGHILSARSDPLYNWLASIKRIISTFSSFKLIYISICVCVSTYREMWLWIFAVMNVSIVSFLYACHSLAFNTWATGSSWLRLHLSLERVSSVSLAVRFVSLMLSLLLPIFVQYNFTIRAMGSHNCHATCPMPRPALGSAAIGFLVLVFWSFIRRCQVFVSPPFTTHRERGRQTEREIG